LSSSCAKSRTPRQTTACGSPPANSTTKAYGASFRTCDPFKCLASPSRAGRSFRPTPRISNRQRCAPASSSRPATLGSARCQSREGHQESLLVNAGKRRNRPLPRRDDQRSRRHPIGPSRSQAERPHGESGGNHGSLSRTERLSLESVVQEFSLRISLEISSL